MLAMIIAEEEKRKPGTISYTSNNPPSRRFHTSSNHPLMSDASALSDATHWKPLDALSGRVP